MCSLWFILYGFWKTTSWVRFCLHAVWWVNAIGWNSLCLIIALCTLSLKLYLINLRDQLCHCTIQYEINTPVCLTVWVKTMAILPIWTLQVWLSFPPELSDSCWLSIAMMIRSRPAKKIIMLQYCYKDYQIFKQISKPNWTVDLK